VQDEKAQAILHLLAADPNMSARSEWIEMGNEVFRRLCQDGEPMSMAHFAAWYYQENGHNSQD